MQPSRINAGQTAARAGMAVVVCGSRLEYLAPFWRVVLANYGLAIALHLGLVPSLPSSTAPPGPPGWPILDGGSL